jgi:autotransporter adhesin
VNAIAIGAGAIATGSVAVGAGASASNGGAAFGDNTVASGTNSAAFGTGTSATASNSVALGSGSVASAPNTVSVGAPGNDRRITNVAAGINPTDAVNVSQLSSIASGLTGQIAGVQTQLNDLTRESRRGIAATASLATAMTPSAPGKTTVSLNSGFFQGEYGVGLAVAHRLNFSTPLIIHGAYGNGGGNQHVGRAGVAFEF